MHVLHVEVLLNSGRFSGSAYRVGHLTDGGREGWAGSRGNVREAGNGITSEVALRFQSVCNFNSVKIRS